MFVIEPNCQVHPSAKINVEEGRIGEGSIIRENVVIEGHRILIGREAYLDRGASIGGGSCFSRSAYLSAGDWLHMGSNSHINIAMGVDIGEALGLGVESKIFTHGAYSDSYELGAPVQWGAVRIGSNVWLPNAWVNPGVNIGDNVVVSARSFVNRDIPSGALYGGIPARLIQENFLPRRLSEDEKSSLLTKIFSQFMMRPEFSSDWEIQMESLGVFVVRDKTRKSEIDIENRVISGDEFEATNSLKDQLRRNGIRFRYSWAKSEWSRWPV